MGSTPERLTAEHLADVQGFVTTGYGHLPLAAYLFVRMHDAGGARQWLTHVTAAITSGKPWPVAASGEKVKPRAAVNVALTASGLIACGLPNSVLCSFPPEFQEGIAFPARSRILGDTEDSAPALWELGGPSTDPVHAVVLVHAKNEGELEAACKAQLTLLEKSGGTVTELPATRQRGYRPEGDREPFGFHDGISQPKILGLAGTGVPTGEFILGYENHYGLIPPVPVVPADLDPGAILPPLPNPYHASKNVRDLGRHGSYVVYRKLQQDVAGFWQFMQRESVRGGGAADAAAMIWLAAKCVGRWPGGAPLALAPDADDPRLADGDNFLYGHDPDGFACPLGAHVRRTNPRDVLKPYGPQQSLSMSDAHRLLRRARVFGPSLFDPRLLQGSSAPANPAVLLEIRDDGRARGIHFFCVNASIRSQFEFVQQTWCNNPHFGGLHANKDPIMGDHEGAGQSPTHMTIPRRPTSVRTSALRRFVTVRAGAYLFMPSLTALRFLGTSQ